MKEVSCRALAPVFRRARNERISLQALIDGAGYPLEHLLNNRERVEWSTLCRVFQNSRRWWSLDDFEQIGSSFASSSLFLPFAVFARLLLTPREIYHWVNTPREGAGNQMFTCVRPTIEDTGPEEITLRLHLDPAYPLREEFFRITKGGMSAIPRLLALPAATVNLNIDGNVGTFVIRYPKGGGVFAKVKRSLIFPFTVRAAARELQEANVVLERRYFELEAARQQLDQQATQLRTAHSISQVVHGDLTLDHTLAALSRAMVDVAGFTAVDLMVRTHVEGQVVAMTNSAGLAPDGVGALELPLLIRGRGVGLMRLWPTADANRIERQQLLGVVEPTVSMAIDDALTFTALSNYRNTLEQRVTERTSELRLARDSLAETVRSLEEAQGARSRIFANINHEIRTPLSLITLAVRDLERRLETHLDDGGRDRLRGIDASVQRLLTLVDGLLLLAASQEGKLRLAPAPHDLAELLQRITTTWTPAAQHAGVSLSCDAPPRCLSTFDDGAIERAVTNLLSNALKFTPSGGAVSLQLEDAGHTLRVAVRDTGIGIDGDFAKRIFGRFEQGRPAVRTGVKGSGIGLAIVREIAVAHGGEVGVANNEGGGSVFTLTLPKHGNRDLTVSGPGTDFSTMVAGPIPDVVHDGAIRDEVLMPVSGAPRATILIAEDDLPLRAAMVDLLREHYRVLVAADGISGLRLAAKHHPDLLLSDVGMPGMNGLELTRRFREHAGNRLAPVILLTAYGTMKDRLAGFDAGAVDYVLKPFQPTELLARIESQLRIRDLALRLHESEKLSALGMLSAGLAHELRNPANSVVNAVEPLKALLPADVLAPGSAVTELLEVLDAGSRRIAQLSRQLLGYSRPGELQSTDEPVQSMLDSALQLTRPLLTDVRVDQELAYEGSVRCARALIVQVLTNLIDNAASAAGPNGWIALRTRRAGANLLIEVGDSGPGVPAELRARLFEPFFTTKPVGKGTGLGLSTSRQIVERHQGTLSLVEGERGGAVFRIEIPIAGAVKVERAAS
jgi:signal transduction histidine kinase